MIQNRIDQKFAELKRRSQKALIAFITAGDPGLKANREFVLAAEQNGADLIELGVPFSDPQADGPVIQASSARSLKRGTNLKKVLKLAADIRRDSQIPLILMGYFNPFMRYGLERFARDAASSGVDGLIVPDLTAEESAPLRQILASRGLHLIYLIAPTSSPQRMRKIISMARGFLYYVSVTGVTGVKKARRLSIGRGLSRLRRLTRLPVCAGFGISEPQIAKEIAPACDGVIVGSALVKALDANPSLAAVAAAKRFLAPFARALNNKG
ncbi:MAG: tryptophan synthase subunit alpha [Candidatus Omnitrophota bacterium]